ncbi:MAG: MarR family transcriptional regulator [Wenzhouxiangellaceae bacterium]
MDQQSIEHASALLERLSRLIHGDGFDAGLKPVQWETLRYLQRANRFSCTPGALTAYLAITKGTVSQTLNALQRKGLVEKHNAPRDRRSVRLVLTPAGRKLLAQDPLEPTRQALKSLGDKRMQPFIGDLETLIGERLKQNRGRPFGLCNQCRHFRRGVDKASPYYCQLLQEPLTDMDADKICLEQEPAAR